MFILLYTITLPVQDRHIPDPLLKAEAFLKLASQKYNDRLARFSIFACRRLVYQ